MVQEKEAQKSLAEEIRPLVERLYSELDRLSYYKILGVGRGASTTAIQNAFYRRAVHLHPDRHHGLEDASLKEKISKVYKRVSEGYKVLSSERSRRLYDRGLRRGDVRLHHNEDPEKQEEKQNFSKNSMNTEIDALMQKASDLLKERSFAQAVVFLEAALQSHPDSSRLQHKLKDAIRLNKLWQG